MHPFSFSLKENKSHLRLEMDRQVVRGGMEEPWVSVGAYTHSRHSFFQRFKSRSGKDKGQLQDKKSCACMPWEMMPISHCTSFNSVVGWRTTKPTRKDRVGASGEGATNSFNNCSAGLQPQGLPSLPTVYPKPFYPQHSSDIRNEPAWEEKACGGGEHMGEFCYSHQCTSY